MYLKLGIYLIFSRGDDARGGDQGEAAGTVHPRPAEEGEADRAREGRARGQAGHGAHPESGRGHEAGRQGNGGRRKRGICPLLHVKRYLRSPRNGKRRMLELL